MAVTHAPDHEHGLGLDTALEFLNTRELESGRLVDHLHRPADASAWFEEHGVVHPSGSPGWSDADLVCVRVVRDALREVVDAVIEERRPVSTAIDLVNDALTAGSTPLLELDHNSVRIGHRHGDSPVDDALATLAAPIVGELASGKPERFRTCANNTCRWTFYDTSPTGRRRWCDMRTCGNRAKAARHRQRTRSEPATSG
jgi:predicted RNA-binding Zn ribbon-like protein